MKFDYQDLSDRQFEILVEVICKKLFGISVQGFAEGPDGGRDAKFVGIAELFPSKRLPWNGITIIQAKHTNGYNKSFSESDFFHPPSKSTVINNEIPRIKKMREQKQLDNYILFANRRLTGLTECEIRKFLSRECDIPESSLYLCGIEQIEIWLRMFPDIPAMVDLDPVDSPLIINSEELAVVVQALAKNKDKIICVLNNPPVPRVSYEKKNKINNMTEAYANTLRRKYLAETKIISSFLAAPENTDLLELYTTMIDEFQLKILSKRKNYQNFDEVFEYLFSLLFNRDVILRQRKHKRITRALLFYMYWICDIGESENAKA